MKQELLQVVSDYSDGIARTLHLLEKKFGRINYILAKNEEQIAKRGFLDDAEKIPYNLHGAGITAFFDGIDVTFDFGLLVHDHVGLDAWHLAMFAGMNRGAYTGLAGFSRDDLEKQFDEVLVQMERDGLLEFNRTTKRYYPISL